MDVSFDKATKVHRKLNMAIVCRGNRKSISMTYVCINKILNPQKEIEKKLV